MTTKWSKREYVKQNAIKGAAYLPVIWDSISQADVVAVSIQYGSRFISEVRCPHCKRQWSPRVAGHYLIQHLRKDHGYSFLEASDLFWSNTPAKTI
jgi:hypothetical protein